MTLHVNEKKAVLKRLRHIKGHLAGVEKMLENDRPIAAIFQQLKAIEAALHQAIYVVLDEQLKKHLAQALVRGIEACPGECDDCDRLNILKREFSKFDLKEVIELLRQIDGNATESVAHAKSSTKKRR